MLTHFLLLSECIKRLVRCQFFPIFPSVNCLLKEIEAWAINAVSMYIVSGKISLKHSVTVFVTCGHCFVLLCGRVGGMTSILSHTVPPKETSLRGRYATQAEADVKLEIYASQVVASSSEPRCNLRYGEFRLARIGV